MNDPLTWSPISLGRWFGTAVRVHILLVLFVAIRLVWSAVFLAANGRLSEISQTACWLGLLLLALAVHELAHAAMAAWLDCDQEEVHLWPLGSLAGPSFVPRSSEHLLVAMAGPLLSGTICLVTAVGLSLMKGGAGRLESPRLSRRGGRYTVAQRCRGRAAEPGLDPRLVRLPERGLDGRQPHPGAAI